MRLISKAGKAISLGNAQRARDQETTHTQESQIRQLSSKSSRKRVTVDPNTRFSSIGQIKQAQSEQKAHEELLAFRKPELEAKKAVAAMLNTSLEACQFEWQL
ncbi:hypothetical protein K3495_g12385 [Podosphaera aphanis]|nr:hypothetical protein K3495_g12385 [Podosphaera aphanis]